MFYLLPMATLVLTYLSLSENFSPDNILMGVLIAGFILAILRPENRPMRWSRIPYALMAIVDYLAVQFLDLLKSGFQVAWIVLDPKLPVSQGIIRIESKSDSELGTALSAHWITLTPGEMVLEVDDIGGMYTHCLLFEESKAKAADAQRRRQRLIRRIFEFD